MLAITIEKDEIGPYLQELTARAGDLADPITMALESGLSDAQTAIQSGGGAFGWAPYSPTTFTIDVALGRSRTGMLQGTGALAASLSRGDAGNLFEVTPTSGEAGSTLPQAMYQQEGTAQSFFLLQFLRSGKREFGGLGIPAREFMAWSETRLPEYDGIFLDYLTGEAGSAA
jgi:hypothetical protein